MRLLFALLSLVALSAPALDAEATPLRISGVAEVTVVDAPLGNDVQLGDQIAFALTYDRNRILGVIDGPFENAYFGPVYDVEFVAFGTGGTFGATATEGRANVGNDVPVTTVDYLDSFAIGSFTDVQGDPLNGFAPTLIDLFVREFAMVPPDLLTDENLPTDPVAVLLSGPFPANVRMTYGSLNVFGDVTSLSSVPIPEPSAALLFCVGGMLVASALRRR